MSQNPEFKDQKTETNPMMAARIQQLLMPAEYPKYLNVPKIKFKALPELEELPEAEALEPLLTPKRSSAPISLPSSLFAYILLFLNPQQVALLARASKNYLQQANASNEVDKNKKLYVDFSKQRLHVIESAIASSIDPTTPLHKILSRTQYLYREYITLPTLIARNLVMPGRLSLQSVVKNLPDLMQSTDLATDPSPLAKVLVKFLAEKEKELLADGLSILNIALFTKAWQILANDSIYKLDEEINECIGTMHHDVSEFAGLPWKERIKKFLDVNEESKPEHWDKPYVIATISNAPNFSLFLAIYAAGNYAARPKPWRALLNTLLRNGDTLFMSLAKRNLSVVPFLMVTAGYTSSQLSARLLTEKSIKGSRQPLLSHIMGHDLRKDLLSFLYQFGNLSFAAFNDLIKICLGLSTTELLKEEKNASIKKIRTITDPKIQYEFGYFYYCGTNFLAKDQCSGLKLIEWAADQKYEPALGFLTSRYFKEGLYLEDVKQIDQGLKYYPLFQDARDRSQAIFGLEYDLEKSLTKQNRLVLETLLQALIKLPLTSIRQAQIEYYLGMCYLLKSREEPIRREIINKALLQYSNCPLVLIKLMIDYLDDFDIALKQQSISLLQQSAKHSQNASYQLGLCYAHGDSVTQDFKQAFKYFEQADQTSYTATANITDKARYQLGLCYANGRGITEDQKEAKKYFELAASKGSAEALRELNLCEKTGMELLGTLPIGPSDRLHEYYTELGICYLLGNGVKQDKEKALLLFIFSKTPDNPLATHLLAICYAYEGTELEKKEAIQLLSSQNSRYAKSMLGECYEKGWGVERDFKQAEKLYKTAAGAGCLIATKALTKLSLLTQASSAALRQPVLVNPQHGLATRESEQQQLGHGC